MTDTTDTLVYLTIISSDFASFYLAKQAKTLKSIYLMSGVLVFDIPFAYNPVGRRRAGGEEIPGCQGGNGFMSFKSGGRGRKLFHAVRFPCIPTTDLDKCCRETMLFFL